MWRRMVKVIEGRSFRNKTMTRLLKPLLIVASLASLTLPCLAAADPERRDRDGARWDQRDDRRDSRNDIYDRFVTPPSAYGYDNRQNEHRHTTGSAGNI
jgi:hypothetical protein